MYDILFWNCLKLWDRGTAWDLFMQGIEEKVIAGMESKECLRTLFGYDPDLRRWKAVKTYFDGIGKVRNDGGDDKEDDWF